MDRRILSFKCSGQKLIKAPGASFSDILSGSKNYLFINCEFDNDADRTIAVFQDGKREEAVELEEGMCPLPDSFADGPYFRMSVYWSKGETEVLTNSVYVRLT